MKFRNLSLVFLFLLTAAVAHGRSFYAAEQHAFSAFPEGSATADFDGDGSLDLVVVYRGDSTSRAAPTCYSAAAQRRTSSSRTITSIPSAGPVGIAAGDLDGDGDADFASLRNVSPGGANTTELELYLNNGSGGFVPGTPLTSIAGNPAQVIATELNGDAQDDLAVIHNHGNLFTPSTLTVFLSDGSGGFGAPTQVSVGGLPADLEAADIDGVDGTDLLVVAGGPSPLVKILFNDGSGGFGASSRNVSTANEPSAVIAADFDGDTRLDLVITHRAVQSSGHQGYSKIRSYLQQPDGTFNFQDELKSGQCPIDVRASHLDGDGRLDLVVLLDDVGGCSWSSGTGVTFLQNPSFDGSNDAFLPGSSFVTGHKPQTLLVADFSDDGEDDIVVTNFGTLQDSKGNDTFDTMSTVVNLHRNDDGDGAMRFSDILPTLDSSVDSLTLKNYQYRGSGGAGVVGDFNQDGYMDLYLLRNNQNAGGNDIMLHAGDPLQFGPGGRPFQLHTGHGATAPGASTTSAVVADFNNDGWPDIYVAGSVGFSQIGNQCCGSAGNCKVANPGEIARMQNFLYLNDGDPDQDGWDGTFTDATAADPHQRRRERAPQCGSNFLVDPREYPRRGRRRLRPQRLDRHLRRQLLPQRRLRPQQLRLLPAGQHADYGMKNGLYMNPGVDAERHMLQAFTEVVRLRRRPRHDRVDGGRPVGRRVGSRPFPPPTYDNDGWVDLYVANDMDQPDGSPLYREPRQQPPAACWLGFADKSVAFGIETSTPRTAWVATSATSTSTATSTSPCPTA